MAITSLDQFVSCSTYEIIPFFVGGGGGGTNAALNNCSLFSATTLTNATSFSHGVIDLASFPVPISGVTVSGLTTGCIVPTNAAGSNTKYIYGVEAHTLRNQHVLCDLLWYGSGMTSSTGYTFNINSAAFAPRDLNGTASGVGVHVAIANCTTSSPVLVTGVYITYTNSNGLSNRTGTLPYIQGSVGFGGSSMLPFSLAAGDIGVSSIQAYVLPAGLGANTTLIAYTELLEIPNFTQENNPHSSVTIANAGLPKIYNGASLFFRSPGITTSNTIYGFLKLCEG